MDCSAKTILKIMVSRTYGLLLILKVASPIHALVCRRNVQLFLSRLGHQDYLTLSLYALPYEVYFSFYINKKHATETNKE